MESARIAKVRLIFMEEGKRFYWWIPKKRKNACRIQRLRDLLPAMLQDFSSEGDLAAFSLVHGRVTMRLAMFGLEFGSISFPTLWRLFKGEEKSRQGLLAISSNFPIANTMVKYSIGGALFCLEKWTTSPICPKWIFLPRFPEISFSIEWPEAPTPTWQLRSFHTKAFL